MPPINYTIMGNFPLKKLNTVLQALNGTHILGNPNSRVPECRHATLTKRRNALIDCNHKL